MAHAYTPGLKVTSRMSNRVIRMLPIKGDVMVQIGDTVTADQIVAAKTKTGEKDAIKVYNGKINGESVVLAIMNFRFIGGSMGSVVGEAVSRAIQKADELKVPFLLVCASYL